MNHFFVLIFLLFAGVVGVIAFLAFQAEKKRKAAIQRVATARGWTYIDKDRHDRPHRYKSFEPFGQGHSRYAFNICTGSTDAAPFELFDYHYAVTRSSGKQTRTDHYFFTVLVLQMPIPSPGLLIRDEHLGHKIFDALGGEDIDFESHEFSKRFWVRSPDRRFAYDMVHTGTMEFLLGTPGWVWQWKGDTLVLHRSGRLRPETIDRLLALGTRFRSLVPRHRIAATPRGNA